MAKKSISMQSKGNIIQMWTKLQYYSHQNSGWGNSRSFAWHLKYWRRFLVFAKLLTNYRAMSQLLDYYTENETINNIVSEHTCILEQAVRNWVFYKSKISERIAIQKSHFEFMQSNFSKEALSEMYLGKGIELWSNQCGTETLKAIVHYKRGHRKEGLLTITLIWGNSEIYLSTFWLAPVAGDKPALWIGSLQGSKGNLSLIRDLTKLFFGYRTKNLVLYTLRGFARELGINSIFAVSNYGFQASHHLYANRRLKTSLDELWEETGGRLCSDKRFFEIPMVEARKNIEDVVAHKRNLYRKRFAMLDEVDAQISDAMQACLKSDNNDLI